MENTVFLQGITLIEVVIQKKFTKEQLQVYKLLLDDIKDEQFINGINNLLRTRVYTNIPSPAEIREYALEKRQNDIEIKIAEGKLKIKKAIGAIGTNKSVIFDDPILHLIIKNLGGWIKLGVMTFDEFENYFKWDFPKIYKAYSSRKNGEIPLVLEGRFNDDKATFVGDKQKALAWQNAYKISLENKLNKNIRRITCDQ